MRVEMRHVHAEREGAVDLGPDFGFRRLRIRPVGERGDIAGEVAFVVDEPGGLRGAGQWRPPVAAPFAGQREVDAEVQ